MQINKDTQNALKTWYPEDHELHTDLVHPIVKFAGESGEILDLIGKHLYKPNFDMWSCKNCGHLMDFHLTEDGNNPDGNWREAKHCIHFAEDTCDCHDYVPKILDELGDLTYYQRIISYLAKHPEAKRCDFPDILEHLSVVNLACATMLCFMILFGMIELILADWK